MKLAIRAFAFALIVAGAAAASVSSSNHGFITHQSATAGLPIPLCGPNMPTCPPSPSVR
jgi:hypothetical protein